MEILVPTASLEKFNILTTWLLTLGNTGINIDSTKYLLFANNRTLSVMDHLIDLFETTHSPSYLRIIFGLMQVNQKAFDDVVSTGSLKPILWECLVIPTSPSDKSNFLILLYIHEFLGGSI